MTVCTRCGAENRAEARFCDSCGAPLAEPAHEQRKTVTVLFCDVTGSTALGESTDPEALRALLARYFERMKGILEAHGASVEKFIGDAVMAVFGVPLVHEDDALRACRAAVEMREALPELGLEGRIGLNTGEVVAGTAERLATGDAVNVAARLEQAAAPGEILIGDETLELVREVVHTEPVEPLELKGKSEPVPAFRLLGVGGELERRHESRFVGRTDELELLRQAWQRVLDHQRCKLVTVVGEAGVGKSRLTAEFLSPLDARVVTGRCLSYGEGITYWPVVEVVKQLGVLPSDPDAATSRRSLLGQSDEGTTADEIAWAFRKLLEEQTPRIAVFDDIQWGEKTFLDLIEHVALLSSGPILLVCLARPDLIERRPDWPVMLQLEPLPAGDIVEMLPATLAIGLREKVERAAGGNPLFVTEMVAVARETDEDVEVPRTLRAVLAARLDQLDAEELSILGCGAVEGEIFHRGAVQALSEEVELNPRLAALVRKKLIRPDASDTPSEDAFRFHHVLIRDTAYQGLPKARRAELHIRLADWLERRPVDLVELDEILGYHLEQAARYQAELGHVDSVLAERAGERLAVAGRRALWRDDRRAARKLLERALHLTRSLRYDIGLELDFAEAADRRQGVELAEAAAARARAEGNTAHEALARVLEATYRADIGLDFEIDKVEALARNALEVLEQGGEHAELARLWRALSGMAAFRMQYEQAVHAALRCIDESRLAHEPVSLGLLTNALASGPQPADKALKDLEAAMLISSPPNALMARARLLAMLCEFEEAEGLAREASERSRELTGNGHEDDLAEIATYKGDHEAAAERLRVWCAYLEARGLQAALSTYAPSLGRSLCALGRYDEAEPLAQLGRELGDEQDAATQMLWRQVQALVHAHRGDHGPAETLADEAVALAERTDSLNLQADAFCDLAEVLAFAGRTDEAVAALEEALERYGRKKNLAMIAQVRPKLGELRAHVS